jgi:hypothetical protein
MQFFESKFVNPSFFHDKQVDLYLNKFVDITKNMEFIEKKEPVTKKKKQFKKLVKKFVSIAKMGTGSDRVSKDVSSGKRLTVKGASPENTK